MNTQDLATAKQKLSREITRMTPEYGAAWLAGHMSVEATSDGGWYDLSLMMDRRHWRTLAAAVTDIGLHAENAAIALAKEFGVRGPREVANVEAEIEENARY